MPRQAATAIENNFSKGLVTEATGLNFPENACTETFNCVFDITGEVVRRFGFDAETNSTPVSINRNNVVTQHYLWIDAGGDGTTSFIVQQIGSILRFYNTTAGGTIVAGLHADTIDLTTFSPSGAPSPSTKECQFATGNGFLFVTHPNLEPFYVTFDVSLNDISATQIDVKIRDFVGEKTDANYDDTSRPTSLSNAHKYNLLNQGWSSDLITNWANGTVSITGTVANGSPNITAVSASNASYLSPGMSCISGGNGASGKTVVQTYPTPPLTTAGTDNASQVQLSGNCTGAATQTMIFQMGNYPGNGDVWWYNKNEFDVFSISAIAQNSATTTSHAPKGHYITSAWKIDRNTLSGLSGLTTDSSGSDRPSSTAFYAGRVWYGGVNHKGYNANVYFSQILDDIDKAGNCYQAQDPTDENLFDLLATDGGMVIINGCGSIHKMFATGSSLLIFASNGVWEITGNQGIGMTATDFSVNKISSVNAISARSFVDVEGLPMWWNVDGIYAVVNTQTGGKEVQSLTTNSIQTFYTAISNNNKLFVKGAYNSLSKIVQWLYRSTETGSLHENYQYDGVLNFNTQTGAFYPWTVDNTSSSINDVIILQGASGNVQEVVLTDEDGTTHVVDGGVDVIIFSTLGNIASADFIYPMSTINGSSYDVNFAKNNVTTFLDWESDTVKDYTSYFISGYQVRGDGQRRFQDNYVFLHLDALVASQLYFQGLYDWALTTDTNRFGTRQLVTNSETNYKQIKKKLLLRGHGYACQFKVTSITGQPFGIIGWSTYVTGNTSI